MVQRATVSGLGLGPSVSTPPTSAGRKFRRTCLHHYAEDAEYGVPASALYVAWLAEE